MSSRPFLNPTKVIDAGNMSGDLISEPTILPQPSIVTYTCQWTGSSPVGTLTVQGSADYKLAPNGTVENAGVWSGLTLVINGITVSSAPVSGSTGQGIIDLSLTGIRNLRVIYTAGSGTGSLTIYVNAKVA